MENTKENRIKYLRSWYDVITNNKIYDLEKAGQNLNNILNKKRQIVIIKSWSELGSELRSELGSELRSELRSELGSELGSMYNLYEYYENLWPIFINEFYPQLKILQKNKKKIAILKELILSGQGYLFINKKKLWIIPMPEIYTENKRLHNLKFYACKFLNKETYWLHGVKFEKKLWEKITQNQISALNILKIENIEQRYVALKTLGAEKILKELDAKLIDGKTEMGNELYQIDNILSKPLKLLKYKCPSTDREYVKFVKPEFIKADEAQAWSHNLVLQEYYSLTIQS